MERERDTEEYTIATIKHIPSLDYTAVGGTVNNRRIAM